MEHFPLANRFVAIFVAVAFSFLTVVVAPVQAAMVGTETILQAVDADADAARERVLQFIQREDVVDRFEMWGVAADEAQARIDTMTDEEVTRLAAQIDQLPAGGDVLGFILAVALISFITLLVLDIMGITDIFTFIKKR